MTEKNLVLYENISQLVTLQGVSQKDGRQPKQEDLGCIENGAMVVDAESNRIEWVGATSQLPKPYQDLPNVFSAEGEVWLPELIESHTHMIYAGDRFHDYAERARGATYQEIAARGGGILTTIGFTREADLAELIESAKQDLERFGKYGIGTIEIKSGYGLSLESEIKILKCIQILQQASSMELVPTFMPAHAVPPEFKGKSDAYVETICKEWLPEIAKQQLATYFDAFVEEGFFSVKDTRKMCEKAKELGFKIKLHVDQFNALGGTELAVEFGATSCDHLEKVTESGIKSLSNAETVAVLCPGASLFTGTDYPPARKLIDAGVRVALSTDYNPGTCPSRNLPLMTTLACSQMKMTVPESIAAITYNAACALGVQKDVGSLEVGKLFKVCNIKAKSYEVLPYSFGEIG